MKSKEETSCCPRSSDRGDRHGGAGVNGERNPAVRDDEKARKTGGARRRPAWGLLLALLLAGAAGWFVRDLAGFKEERGAAAAADAPKVTVFRVAKSEFNPVKEYIGHIEPLADATILPEVEGYVSRVTFREGAAVEKGDVLFEIDTDRYAATENLRKAEVLQAKAAIVQAEAELEKSERYLRRMKAVDGRGITQTEMDAAETGESAARAALQSAKAGLSRAEANLALASIDVKRSVIRAPFAGRVGKALRHVGDWVSPSGGALARIVCTDPVRVAFTLPDREFAAWREEAARHGGDMRAGKRLRIRLPDDSVYAETGEWDFDDNEMDAATATISLRLSFPNPDGALVPNAYVRVLVDSENAAPGLVVPESAVEFAEDGWVAWVLDSSGAAERRVVDCSGAFEGRVLVKKGLAEGERIVWRGVHKMARGVKPVVVGDSGR